MGQVWAEVMRKIKRRQIKRLYTYLGRRAAGVREVRALCAGNRHSLIRSQGMVLRVVDAEGKITLEGHCDLHTKENLLMSDSAEPTRPRLNLKPRDPNAAKQLELQRSASGKVGWCFEVAHATPVGPNSH
jgi:hypothetical protein